MSELEAVNLMLFTIGEQPVNTLEVSGVAEVAIARDTLQETSRDVQADGWHFNTEHGWQCLPDTEGYIHLPRNCLHAFDPSKRHDVMQRGFRLYDRRRHAYEFDGPLALSMVLFLPFEELNHPARRYIFIKAARRFQERTFGSQVIEQFTGREEIDAKGAFQAADAAAANYNILHDNQPTLRTVEWDRGL
jgi:hypothetical protein